MVDEIKRIVGSPIQRQAVGGMGWGFAIAVIGFEIIRVVTEHVTGTAYVPPGEVSNAVQFLAGAVAAKFHVDQ